MNKKAARRCIRRTASLFRLMPVNFNAAYILVIVTRIISGFLLIQNFLISCIQVFL